MADGGAPDGQGVVDPASWSPSSGDAWQGTHMPAQVSFPVRLPYVHRVGRHTGDRHVEPCHSSMCP
eukprot:CAMPEP_0195099968 /NCGR_PEP_ID=MMETSP0448-20130528/60510_1 /TAXON_ID=66468 /ORGANISM="Heterocapsa triquestra, Strain CCMP 448" /LENGTH=65 /DNA_ID=CAMNT_0040134993 /DNA_START=514 /DNA_END=708 /DNA_ORIENTATION=-